MSYIVGYFAVWIGLLLIQGVTLAFLVPSMALILLLWASFGDFGIWLGGLLIAPAWLWFAIRFWFPAGWQVIWIDGRFVLFAFHRVTPQRMIRVVNAQLSVLRSDLQSLSTRSGS